MKCLSVSQPFADLIVSGKKTIELRKWNTNFRGEFLIHSPLKIKTKDCKRLKILKKPVTGAIIGKVEIVDVKKYNSKSEVKADFKKHLASSDFFNRKYGFMLKNPKLFRIPIPYKGKLGFFDVKFPKTNINKKELTMDIIDEEQRYRLVGHH
ncbi:MAG: ASCH domain-containing protein [Nitrosopumilaceae archaeon]